MVLLFMSLFAFHVMLFKPVLCVAVIDRNVASRLHHAVQFLCEKGIMDWDYDKIMQTVSQFFEVFLHFKVPYKAQLLCNFKRNQ